MTDTHSSANSNILRNAVSPDALEAALRANEAAERQAKDDARQVEGAPKTRADTDRPAAQTRDETARPKVERVQTSPRTPAGAAETTGQPIPNAQAMIGAATALAEGGQDALRAWLELAQNAMHANVEALSRLAGCRSWIEMMSVQSSILQERIQQSVECGAAIARASTLAITRADHAMHGGRQPAPQPAS